MIAEHCLGPDVDRSRVHPSAEILGSSYVTGPATSVGPGCILRDARVHNAVILESAGVFDAVVTTEGEPARHKCDNAGRCIVGGANPAEVDAFASVEGSTLINTRIGRNTSVRDSWSRDATIGPGNAIASAKLVMVETGRNVSVSGPTEVTEAWLGDGTTIDQRGYFEGIFSNAFRKLRFDPQTEQLQVTEVLQIPHVSRYGLNTINSSNSGKVLAQPRGELTGYGPHRGLWNFTLLSHEQIELGPCCWVTPWTKVIGQSAQPHVTDDALVNDRLTTYVMPFALAGIGGESTRGLVMPGEMSVGYGPKRRYGAWVFTYAPDLVIRMVKRLHDALEPERKTLADTIVNDAIRVAIEMTLALAFTHGVDLSIPCGQQRRGWPRWIARTHELLRTHLDSLWEFRDGQPVDWFPDGNRWNHPRMASLLRQAPDALEKQVSEEEVFDASDRVPPMAMPLPAGAVKGSGGPPRIAPGAKVASGAFVGPGTIVDAGCEIAAGAKVWNSIVRDSSIGPGAVVYRSVLESTRIESAGTLRSSVLSRVTLGAGAVIDAASVRDTELAAHSTIGPFSRIDRVLSHAPVLLGGGFAHAELDTILMMMHLSGACRHVKGIPTVVELPEGQCAVRAVPMIGGGAVLNGTADSPVVTECAFIGSNAVVERGTYIGFGCFILGTLGPGAGLPPFTFSSGADPSAQQIGAVLTSQPTVIITHFVDWAFQALGVSYGPAIAELVPQSIRRGIHAIERELANRARNRKTDPGSPFACYSSLPLYTEKQLQEGLAVYRAALTQGCWNLLFDGVELHFDRGRGSWKVANGSVLWERT